MSNITPLSRSHTHKHTCMTTVVLFFFSFYLISSPNFIFSCIVLITPNTFLCLLMSFPVFFLSHVQSYQVYVSSLMWCFTPMITFYFYFNNCFLFSNCFSTRQCYLNLFLFLYRSQISENDHFNFSLRNHFFSLVFHLSVCFLLVVYFV